MEKSEVTLEFMKVIAPVFVQEGLNIQNRLVAAGSNPANCTVGGKDIPHAYAESAKEWAVALAEEWFKDKGFAD